MKNLSIALFAATIAVASTAASAWGWGNNGYNDGYGNGYGDGAFDGDFGFNMNMSARGHGRGYGNGYNGYRGYNGYGYAPYGYGYAPVQPAVEMTEEQQKAIADQQAQYIESMQKAQQQAQQQAAEFYANQRAPMTDRYSQMQEQREARIAEMDARIDPWRLLNAGLGDIHVIRNAGALVTPDAERSLVVSQRALNTTRIDVIMHTRCGMLGFDDAGANAELAEAGAPPINFGGFGDLETELRRGVAHLRSNPALLHRNAVRGYLYDIDSAQLRLVVEM